MKKAKKIWKAPRTNRDELEKKITIAKAIIIKGLNSNNPTGYLEALVDLETLFWKRDCDDC